jgi:hypothetical protein
MAMETLEAMAIKAALNLTDLLVTYLRRFLGILARRLKAIDMRWKVSMASTNSRVESLRNISIS